MEAEVIVYMMTLFFGVAAFIIIKKKGLRLHRFCVLTSFCFEEIHRRKL